MPRDAERVPAPAIGRRKFLTAFGLGGAASMALGGRSFAEMASAATVLPRYKVPIDSAPHKRTWMAWPDSSAIWGNKLAGIQANIGLIARTIAKYEPVIMMANAASVARARTVCGSTVVVIGTIPVDDCWTRDTGAVFRTNGAGGLNAVGTNFNGWGNKQIHAKDALVASRMAAYAGVPFTATGFVGEGGAIETDGDGTLMATRSSLVNSNRNPGKTAAQIAYAVCGAYGASKLIWFTGVKGQDITDDHVDATSRFVGDATGLVQWPLATDTDVFSVDARQQYQVLSTATDAQGVRVGVTKLRGPDYNLIRSTNPKFLGSYANYHVVNGAVISAQFGDRAADAAAKVTLARLFPGRVIEQLNIDYVGAGGGGIHCVTQQEPRR